MVVMVEVVEVVVVEVGKATSIQSLFLHDIVQSCS